MRSVILGSRVSSAPSRAKAARARYSPREIPTSAHIPCEAWLRCRGQTPRNLAWQRMPLLRSSWRRRQTGCGKEWARCSRGSGRAPSHFFRSAVAFRRVFLQACIVSSSRTRAPNRCWRQAFLNRLHRLLLRRHSSSGSFTTLTRARDHSMPRSAAQPLLWYRTSP
jgi:hypothetical protein